MKDASNIQEDTNDIQENTNVQDPFSGDDIKGKVYKDLSDFDGTPPVSPMIEEIGPETPPEKAKKSNKAVKVCVLYFHLQK